MALRRANIDCAYECAVSIEDRADKCRRVGRQVRLRLRREHRGSRRHYPTSALTIAPTSANEWADECADDHADKCADDCVGT